MPYAYVAEVNNGASGSAATITQAVTYAATERAVVRISYGSATPVACTVTDNGGNTYSQIGAHYSTSLGYAQSYGYYISNGAVNAGSVTVTADWGANPQTFREISVTRLTGLLGSAQLLKGGSINNPGAVADIATTGTMTPSAQPAAVIGFCQLTNDVTNIVAGTGMTDRGLCAVSDAANGVVTRRMDYRITSTANTAMTATPTATGFGRFEIVAVVVSEVAASAGTGATVLRGGRHSIR